MAKLALLERDTQTPNLSGKELIIFGSESVGFGVGKVSKTVKKTENDGK